MSSRWGAIAIAIALGIVGCGTGTTTPSSVPPSTAPRDPLACEPAPIAAEVEIYEVVTPAARAALVLGSEAYYLLVPLDCTGLAAELGELRQLAAACAEGPCGTAIAHDRLERLARGLASATWTPTQIGGIQAATGMLEGGLVVTWPRSEPIDPIINGIGRSKSAPPTAPEQRCCIGCAPCLPNQCGSTPPPTRPRRGLVPTDGCEPCDARIERYCPGGGPASDPDCECAVECCAQHSSP